MRPCLGVMSERIPLTARLKMSLLATNARSPMAISEAERISVRREIILEDTVKFLMRELASHRGATWDRRLEEALSTARAALVDNKSVFERKA